MKPSYREIPSCNLGRLVEVGEVVLRFLTSEVETWSAGDFSLGPARAVGDIQVPANATRSRITTNHFRTQSNQDLTAQHNITYSTGVEKEIDGG